MTLTFDERVRGPLRPVVEGAKAPLPDGRGSSGGSGSSGDGSGAVEARVLMTEVCQCRKRKRRGKPFCLDCFVRLRPEMQTYVSMLTGERFEAAYARAVEWLRV